MPPSPAQYMRAKWRDLGWLVTAGEGSIMPRFPARQSAERFAPEPSAKTRRCCPGRPEARTLLNLLRLHVPRRPCSRACRKVCEEARNGRIGSAFKLGCPRMAVVTCGPAQPVPRPFSNFATGPHLRPRIANPAQLRISRQFSRSRRAPGVEPLSEIPDGAKPILPLQTGGRLRRPEPDRGSDSIQADRRRRTATVQA